MDALVAQGRDAVPLVLPLLQDRDEGVRWSAVKVLAEIGGDEVLLPLVDLIDQNRNVSDAVGALKTLTGQDFGSRGAAWREWLVTAKSGGGAAAGILSDKDLVGKAVEGLPATVAADGRDYVVTISLPGRRTQVIRLDFSAQDADGQAMVHMATPCGVASAEHYEAVLKLNMSIPYGAVALARLDESLCFAMVATHHRATLHPEALAKSILSLAGQGDALEARFGRKDTY